MPQTVVNVGSSEGDAFVNPTGGVEADSEYGAIAVVFESFVKDEVYFGRLEIFIIPTNESYIKSIHEQNAEIFIEIEDKRYRYIY